MKTVRKHMSRQQEVLTVVALTLVTVLLYTLWGATILRAEKSAQATQSTQFAINR